MVVDTIEERIIEVLREKRIEFETYIEDADNAQVPELTRDDLRRILGLSTIEADGLKG
jgi:SNF2 family DNA or RNA helicase